MKAFYSPSGQNQFIFDNFVNTSFLYYEEHKETLCDYGPDTQFQF